MDSEPNTSPDYSRKPSPLARLQQTRLPVWVSLLLLLALVIVAAWATFAISGAERRLTQERQQLEQKLEADTSALRREAQEVVARQTQEMQLLFGTALAWAVRSAMLRNNLDEIDQYFGELVKNTRIALVLLADVDGKVLRTTDRKYLDAQFSTHFPEEYLKVENVVARSGEGERIRLVLPIQGLTARLGTVLLVYATP
jgi:cell division protein FtsL